MSSHFTTEYVGTDSLANGGCYFCNGADNLVSAGIVIEGEGILAICKGCVQYAAEALGLELMDAAVLEQRDSLVAELKDTRAELAEAEMVVVDIVDAANEIRQRKERRELAELKLMLERGKGPDGKWLSQEAKAEIASQIEERTSGEPA